jgi:hypothetical protein
MNINSYYELDKLLNISKSFNGKIFGDIIRDYYMGLINNNSGDVDINNLSFNIIFDSETTTRKFIRIISQHYEINKNLLINDKNINSYYVVINYINDNNYESKIVNLNIIESINNISYNYYISDLTHNIDLNMLSLSNNSLLLLDLFSYFNYNSTINFSFNGVLYRNCNKIFSFIIKPININMYINNLDIAYKIVNNNFRMDDYYNNSISVLFKWKDRNKNIRINYCENKKKQLNENSECTICSSEFKDDDIVINTNCNHNFHWICCNNANTGLKNWIQNFKVSCPICRKTNLNFI